MVRSQAHANVDLDFIRKFNESHFPRHKLRVLAVQLEISDLNDLISKIEGTESYSDVVYELFESWWKQTEAGADWSWWHLHKALSSPPVDLKALAEYIRNKHSLLSPSGDSTKVDTRCSEKNLQNALWSLNSENVDRLAVTLGFTVKDREVIHKAPPDTQVFELIQLWVRKHLPEWGVLIERLKHIDSKLAQSISSKYIQENGTDISINGEDVINAPSRGPGHEYTSEKIQSKLMLQLSKEWGFLLKEVRQQLCSRVHSRKIPVLLSFLSDCNSRVRGARALSAKSIGKLFDLFTRRAYWDCLNYDLLALVSDFYSEPTVVSLVKKYEAKFRGHHLLEEIILNLPYYRERRMSVEEDTLAADGDHSDTWNKLGIKLDLTYKIDRVSWKYVCERWVNVTEWFRIQALTAAVDQILNKCIQIVWIIAPNWGCRIMEHLLESEEGMEESKQWMDEQAITKAKLGSICLYDDGSFGNDEELRKLWLKLALLTLNTEELDNYAVHQDSDPTDCYIHHTDLQQTFTTIDPTESIFMFLVRNNFDEFTHYCLSHTLDKESLEMGKGVLLAVQNDWSGMLGVLLEHGANSLVQTEDGSTPLLVAAAAGNTRAVHLLTERDAEQNRIDIDTDNAGRTALSLAAMNGHIDIVEYLLGHVRSDINHQDKEDKTALHLAVENGHLQVVKLILGKKDKDMKTEAILDLQDNKGKTVLDAAETQEEIREAILSAIGEAPSSVKEEPSAMVVTKKKPLERLRSLYNEQRFISACKSGNLEKVKLYVGTKNVDVNYTDVIDLFKWNGLMWASHNGHAAVAKYLLDNGADQTVVARGRWTALILAARNAHWEVVQCLVDHMQEHRLYSILEHKNWQGWSAFNWVCQTQGLGSKKQENLERRRKTAEILIQSVSTTKPELLNMTTNDKWTPAMQAAQDNNIDVVKLFVEAKANLELTNDNGWTVLMIANKHNREEVARTLVLGGAHVETQKAKDGMTALHIASAKGQTKCVEAMLKALREIGTDDEKLREIVNIQDKWGMTALTLASKHGHKAIAELLIAAGADINAKSKMFGWPPLFYAIKGGYSELIELFVRNKAKLNDKDEAQQTALGLAYNQKRKVFNLMIRLLKSQPEVLKAVTAGDTPTSPGGSPEATPEETQPSSEGIPSPLTPKEESKTEPSALPHPAKRDKYSKELEKLISEATTKKKVKPDVLKSLDKKIKLQNNDELLAITSQRMAPASA